MGVSTETIITIRFPSFGGVPERRGGSFLKQRPLPSGERGSNPKGHCGSRNDPYNVKRTLRELQCPKLTHKWGEGQLQNDKKTATKCQQLSYICTVTKNKLIERG